MLRFRDQSRYPLRWSTILALASRLLLKPRSQLRHALAFLKFMSSQPNPADLERDLIAVNRPLPNILVLTYPDDIIVLNLVTNEVLRITRRNTST